MTRRARTTTIPSPTPVPLGVEGEGCSIIYGHNASIKKVLMQFSVAATRLIFTPEEAREAAAHLRHYADMADGKKTQG